MPQLEQLANEQATDTDGKAFPPRKEILAIRIFPSSKQFKSHYYAWSFSLGLVENDKKQLSVVKQGVLFQPEYCKQCKTLRADDSMPFCPKCATKF